ncbi:hypothetical protein CEUSTIGMA_g11720.t1 [Chlamydomonas eustigma]|uniref:Uncharacterized protein n=1 Tax=Chlamydomonas eustigma TaxID=1157962 RepID=A0A250XMJ9_9CHLO|nr:hypothetical protein CEUSTIGMA_g11720.t1 [Chlamydomonas eustigma]|eukprot:GAX84298.1 hypothetical protein CEUSTIGMA_g11720.t1 [Chlamydomonas eustigma]
MNDNVVDNRDTAQLEDMGPAGPSSYLPPAAQAVMNAFKALLSAPRTKSDIKDFEKLLVNCDPADAVALAHSKDIWKLLFNCLAQVDNQWDLFGLLLNRLSLEPEGRVAAEESYQLRLAEIFISKSKTARGDKQIERLGSMACILALLSMESPEAKLVKWGKKLCTSVKDSLEKSQLKGSMMEAYTVLSVFIKLMYTATGSFLAKYIATTFINETPGGVHLLFRVAKRGLLEEELAGVPKIVAEKSLVILSKLNADAPDERMVPDLLEPLGLGVFLVRIGRECSWVQSQDIAITFLARLVFDQQHIDPDFLDRPEVVDMLRHILNCKSTALKLTGVAFISLCHASLFYQLVDNFEQTLTLLAAVPARTLKHVVWESGRGIWGMPFPMSLPASRALQDSDFLFSVADKVPEVMPRCLRQLLSLTMQRQVALCQGEQLGSEEEGAEIEEDQNDDANHRSDWGYTSAANGSDKEHKSIMQPENAVNAVNSMKDMEVVERRLTTASSTAQLPPHPPSRYPQSDEEASPAELVPELNVATENQQSAFPCSIPPSAPASFTAGASHEAQKSSEPSHQGALTVDSHSDAHFTHAFPSCDGASIREIIQSGAEPPSKTDDLPESLGFLRLDASSQQPAIAIGGNSIEGVAGLQPEVKRLLSEAEGVLLGGGGLPDRNRPKPTIRIKKSMVNAVLALKQMHEGGSAPVEGINGGLSAGTSSIDQKHDIMKMSRPLEDLPRAVQYQLPAVQHPLLDAVPTGRQQLPSREGTLLTTSCAGPPTSKRLRQPSSRHLVISSLPSQIGAHNELLEQGETHPVAKRLARHKSVGSQSQLLQEASQAIQLNSYPPGAPLSSSERKFGTEDIRELNSLLDGLYMKRDILGPRGHVLVKNMAEGAANISTIVFIRTYRLPHSATVGLDERLCILRARAQLVFDGIMAGESLDLLLPFSELLSAESGVVRRDLEAQAKMAGIPATSTEAAASLYTGGESIKYDSEHP